MGASVGLAAVTGTLRFLYGWSLKPLIYLSLAPVLLLTVYMSSDPELAKVIGLAWDAGAVTTGPVTVPLVLALGIGIAAAAGKGGSGLSGFGIVTLASLFPVIGVMLLGLYVAAISSPAEIVAAAQAATEAGQLAAPWHEVSPGLEIVSGLRAIVPLVIFLMVVLKLLLRQNLPRRGEILLGIALTVVGMCVFNLGLTYGLSKLGGSAGSLIPAAFMQTPGADNSPLYIYQVGLVLALAFAWVLGYGATVAEPALNALGVTAETLTNGFIRKRSLIRAVSIGVACGIAVGVAKLVFGLPLVWLVVPPYLIAVVLTVFRPRSSSMWPGIARVSPRGPSPCRSFWPWGWGWAMPLTQSRVSAFFVWHPSVLSSASCCSDSGPVSSCGDRQRPLRNSLQINY